jgi:hypothetical protein
MLGWHRDPLATSEKLQIPNPKWRAVLTGYDKILGPSREALGALEFVRTPLVWITTAALKFVLLDRLISSGRLAQLLSPVVRKCP